MIETNNDNDEASVMNDVAISKVGALMADAARASMLVALCGDIALPAGELAERAGISASTTSIHLTKLLEAGWLAAEQYGRHRYYRLAAPEVARLLAQAMTVASIYPATKRTPERERHSLPAQYELRRARTCYDHLAGELGVSLTEALLRQGVLEIEDKDYLLTEQGRDYLKGWGVDIEAALRQRRAFARRCLDWTERRNHIGGALGATICNAWLEHGWVQRAQQGRALVITPAGEEQLHMCGIALS